MKSLGDTLQDSLKYGTPPFHFAGRGEFECIFGYQRSLIAFRVLDVISSSLPSSFKLTLMFLLSRRGDLEQEACMNRANDTFGQDSKVNQD